MSVSTVPPPRPAPLLTAVRPRPWARLGLWIGTLLLVFAAGAAAGGATYKMYLDWSVQNMVRNPNYTPILVAERLQRDLSLTNEQTVQVKGIMERQNAAMHKLRMESHPKWMAIVDQMKREMNAVLTEPQRLAWEKQTKEMWARWAQNARRREGEGDKRGNGDSKRGNRKENEQRGTGNRTPPQSEPTPTVKQPVVAKPE